MSPPTAHPSAAQGMTIRPCSPFVPGQKRKETSSEVSVLFPALAFGEEQVWAGQGMQGWAGGAARGAGGSWSSWSSWAAASLKQ